MPGSGPSRRTPVHGTRPAVVLAAGLVLSVGPCACGSNGPEASSSPARRDSAGVEVVVNESPDRPLARDLPKELDLGSVGNPTTSFHDLPEQAVAFGRCSTRDWSGTRGRTGPP